MTRSWITRQAKLTTLRRGFVDSSCKHTAARPSGVALAGECCGVAAVDRQNRTGGFPRLSQRDERLGNVFREYLFTQQVALDVLLHRQASRLGPFREQSIPVKPRLNPIRVDGIHPHSHFAYFDGVLPRQSNHACLGQRVGTEAGTGVEGALGGVEQQSSAQSLALEYPHRGLGNVLMSEEV